METRPQIASNILTIPGREDLRDISQTPNRTIYAFTPGGTRITYDRSALLFMRNSPLAKTPPRGMHAIPGITSPNVQEPVKKPVISEPKIEPIAKINNPIDIKPKPAIEDEMFNMDE